MAKELTAKFKNRADTANNWSSANPILDLGELGLEKDTNKIKFGDGVSTWNSLPYYSDIPTASSITIADAGNLITATNVEDALQENRQQINDLDAEVIAHKADGTQHKKTARFVIGTSTAGWTAKDCDYLCDGTNDQEEIIQALNALPATGGEVVILDGTYNITASINIPKDNVSIRGSGNATTLKRMYNSTSASSGATARGLITLNEKSGCKIQDLQIDGNKATYTASYNYGIRLSSSSDNTITGNTCNNNSYGIYLYSSSNNTVTGNTCNNNSNGIYLNSSSDNTVTGNTCIRGTGQTSDYASNQYTILLSGTGNDYNLISSNNCMGKAPVVEGGTGNTVINNKWNATSDFEDLRTDVGDKTTLITTNKTNLVNAVNETKAQINTLDADVDAHKADTANYYVPPFTVPATDGTGEINAATIISAGLYSLYDALVATYPDYITREFLGKDASDTLPIYKYIFAPKNYTKTIIVGAGIHGVGDNGDPKDNPIALYYAMKTICENWQNDRKLADLRWDCQIVVMPIENPWGFDNEHRYNANGVDLNRNFDWHWEDFTGGAAYSSDYKGTAPFSEPETQYIRDTLMAHPEAVAYLAFHAWDDITEFKYAYRASSFSVLNEVAENLIDYSCAKYDVDKDIGTLGDTRPTAYNYAEKLLNIPSANPEYVVFEQGVPHRTSELNTRMVEWYLNWIYVCKLDRFKNTEGTFTPYLYGTTTAGENTYNIQSGFYKIVDGIVYINGYIALTAKDDNMAGNIRIGGLPFYSANVFRMNNTGSLGRTEYLSFGTAKAIHLQVSENSDYIVLYKVNDGDARSFVQAEDIGKNCVLVFSIWYRIK